MHGHQPLAQRDFAFLEDRAYAYRELFAAGPALPSTGRGLVLAIGLGREPEGPLLAAMRAERLAVRPSLVFQKLTGLVFIREHGRHAGQIQVGIGASGRSLAAGRFTAGPLRAVILGRHGANPL